MPVTINVDMDKKCSRCGKNGATQNGICMKCMGNMVKKGELNHIIKKVKGDRMNESENTKLVDGIRDMVDRLLEEKADHIGQAVELTEDGKVSVGIGVKIVETEIGVKEIKVSLRLVKERIKAEKAWLLDSRPNLPGM